MRAAALLVGLSVLAGCGEPEAETHSTERMLEAANAEKDRAMVAGDAAALENFYTADYQLIDDDGEVHDKRSQVEFMTRDADLISAASSDVQVRLARTNSSLLRTCRYSVTFVTPARVAISFIVAAMPRSARTSGPARSSACLVSRRATCGP